MEVLENLVTNSLSERLGVSMEVDASLDKLHKIIEINIFGGGFIYVIGGTPVLHSPTYTCIDVSEHPFINFTYVRESKVVVSLSLTKLLKGSNNRPRSPPWKPGSHKAFLVNIQKTLNPNKKAPQQTIITTQRPNR